MPQRSTRISEPDHCHEIISAALERFLHFGYNKTTMAEIADDVGMSAANLYRYFENKQDIAAACCLRCMTDGLERLRKATESKSSFAERLESYALTMVDYTHELAAPESKVGELVDMMTSERASLIHEKLAVHYALITEMLIDGHRAGEILCHDPTRAAETIYSALVLFDVPLFVGLHSKSEFQQQARDVVRMIIAGLLPR